MDNKSIINGIDVSECEFYFEDNGVIAPDGTPERANICTSPERSCENNDSCYCNKDCYFKQLKRLQEENEKLKNKNNDLIEEIASGNIDITILQKENEELIKNQCCPETCEYIATEIIRYTNVCEVNLNYKQALEEIKDYCIKTTSRPLERKFILTIIVEVLNDRD